MMHPRSKTGLKAVLVIFFVGWITMILVNEHKTEVVLISSKFRDDSSLDYVNTGNERISLSDKATSLKWDKRKTNLTKSVPKTRTRHAKSNRNLDLKDFALENKNLSIVPTRNKHKLVTWYDKQLEIIVKITRAQVESRLFKVKSINNINDIQHMYTLTKTKKHNIHKFVQLTGFLLSYWSRRFQYCHI